MADVNKKEFWAKRIQQAKLNKKLHWSVFLANDNLWNRLLKAHLKVINKFIKPTQKVLDAGCGYGRMSEYFTKYVGVDFSPDFIEEAKRLYPDKEFIVADLKNLPFKDKEFAWGLIVSVKHMIIGNCGSEDWEQMEKEIKRVCKKVLILEYGEMESNFDTEESLAKYEIL